ncbi:MAG: HD domain-containing protein [Sedimentisphaerales bacterium]|nr:HD domain-containing protein [Sedimentisphaerales bacterium]
MVKCPGQDQRFWKPEDIFEVKCPGCNHVIEFFKDEPKLKCRKCGQMVANPKIDLGCAEWCQYGEQCLGITATKRATYLRDKLIYEMKRIFGEDQKRINHALAVLDFAEKIQTQESGDPLIVKAAAILHDIGIHQAEQKYGSSAGKYQEIEGPPIAEEILKRYNIDSEAIEHIYNIIANHHTLNNFDTAEFRIILDADRLVNIPEDLPDASEEKLQRIIEKHFKTQEGKRIAKELFLKAK